MTTSATGMVNNLYSKVFEVYEPLIDTRGVREEPVLVVFSAIPGSGKSELTKRLVRDYGFLRVANKDVRESTAVTHHEDDVSAGDYTLWLLDKLTEKRKYSIVLDRNVDQWYEPSIEWAERNGYEYRLVRVDVAPEILDRRLMRREKDRSAKAFEYLDFYSDEHRKMGLKLRPSYSLKDDYNLELAAKTIAGGANNHA